MNISNYLITSTDHNQCKRKNIKDCLPVKYVCSPGAQLHSMTERKAGEEEGNNHAVVHCSSPAT